jgi:16S rRNA (adenine1518-N6/adenine1519-N6)-dimethyltransferase
MFQPPTSHRRKALGQHFLRNLAAADAIVGKCDLEAGEPVLEVGPGRGVLTERLLAKGALVVAVERDEDLAEELRARFGETESLHLVGGDARRIDLDELIRPHLITSGRSRARVLANLPYSVSGEILARLLMCSRLFASLTLLLQREVVDRICAPPGSRTYGSLSVLSQYFTSPKCVMHLEPGSFQPKPKVRSALVSMPFREPRELSEEEERAYPGFIRALFSRRRRVLPHNLRTLWGADPREIGARLASMGIDPARRPETLSREESLAVFKAMRESR